MARVKLIEKHTVTLKRYSGGDYSDTTGLWVPSTTPSDVVIKCNVQPFKFSQTMMLPEADRTKDWINIWSKSEIRKMAEGEDGWDADTFSWHGSNYKVMQVKIWDGYHYHAQACAIGKTPVGSDMNG